MERHFDYKSLYATAECREGSPKMITNVNDDHSVIAEWFKIEADGFMGAPQRSVSERLVARVVARMRRRVRAESLISGGVMHAARAALYVGVAYVLKLMFGVSIAVQHIR
jgi:hypothetical protein